MPRRGSLPVRYFRASGKSGATEARRRYVHIMHVRAFPVLVGFAASCSVMAPTGLEVISMNATASAGELRITTGEYDADGSGEFLYAHRSVLLDVAAGRLGEAPLMPSGAADSSVLEFGEAPEEMSGYTQRSVGGNLLISGKGLADASFELPGLVGADGI